MGSVVCVGLVTLDVVQVVERVPGLDEKVVALDGWTTFGGPAANAAATCAALGVPVRLVSALGSGPVADLVRAGLESAGVEVVDLAPRLADLVAVSSVLVTEATGTRAVVSRNATGAPDLSAGAVRVAVGGPGDVVLVDGHHRGAATVVATRARADGATVLADGGSWKPGLDRLLAEVDVAVLSADFRLPTAADPDALLGEVARLGPSVVARTDGPRPVLVRTADGVVHEIEPPTVPVVDTLGAGDVLHGGVAAALAQGADVLEAVAAGVRLASRSVRARGALGWVR
ncbi:MAG: PfkB family carbohydrate kinase [Micrococcales bacterium]|nr:PfkB family carbohydrate kinase [Micrococcales bacterium]